MPTETSDSSHNCQQFVQLRGNHQSDPLRLSLPIDGGETCITTLFVGYCEKVRGIKIDGHLLILSSSTWPLSVLFLPTVTDCPLV